MQDPVRGVLRYAARAADVIELTGLGRTLPDGQAHVPDWAPTAVDQRVALIEAQRSDRPYRLSALVQQCTITDSRTDALHAFRAELAELMGHQRAPTMSDLVETPYVLIGSDDEILHQLHTNRDRWGITRYTVRTEALDALAPIIDRLRRESAPVTQDHPDRTAAARPPHPTPRPGHPGPHGGSQAGTALIPSPKVLAYGTWDDAAAGEARRLLGRPLLTGRRQLPAPEADSERVEGYKCEES